MVKRKRWLQVLAVVLVGVLVVMGAVRSPVLAVRSLDVESGERVPAPQAIAASGLETDVPMLGVDVDAAAHRLAVLPWVKSATVTRHWPGTISVRIIERRAVAQLPGPGGTWFVVDGSGRLVDQYGGAVPNLIRIDLAPVVGPAGVSLGPEWSDALHAAAGIPPVMQDRLVSVSGRGPDLTVSLAAGGSVRLCGTDELTDKLLAVNTLLSNVDLNTVGVIDVCAPAAPVLTLRSSPV